MCLDPISALAIGGTVLGVAGDLQQGAAESRAAKANAAQLKAQAELRRKKAAVEAEAAKREYQRKTGNAMAQIAATGITVGSFSDVLADNAAEAALEQQIIKFNGEAEASQLLSQAGAQEQAGKDAVTGSYFKAAGRVVGSVKATTEAGGSGVSFGNIFG